MWSWVFWRNALERAAKTVAQSLVAVFGAGAFNLLTANWSVVLATALMTGALSVLTSIISAPIGPADSPSLVPGRWSTATNTRRAECRGSSDSGRHRAAPGDLQPDSAGAQLPTTGRLGDPAGGGAVGQLIFPELSLVGAISVDLHIEQGADWPGLAFPIFDSRRRAL